MSDVNVLYCDPRGIYSSLLDKDLLWDEKRDARSYNRNDCIVAHPPCQRWSKIGKQRCPEKHTQDEGCFLSALLCLLRVGGVLEHPEGSAAFRFFAIPAPVRGAGWRRITDSLWVCSVAQFNYGHDAYKWTWLIYCSPEGIEPYPIDFSIPTIPARKEVCLMSRRQRIQTPILFARELLSLAHHSRSPNDVQ